MSSTGMLDGGPLRGRGGARAEVRCSPNHSNAGRSTSDGGDSVALTRARLAVARATMALATLVLALVCVFASAATAASPSVTYSKTQTIPVPPASNYAGSGGGDGWSVSLSKSQVFNVFHHNGVLDVVCHNQSDASTCWGPDVITDSSGNNFATGGQPGTYLSQNTGKLYVYATRTDGTGGVVCIDTTQGATSPNPFCGFTALDNAGESPLNGGGWGELTGPMLVGNHWYSFNYVPGVNVSGNKNKLFCFDVSTDAACAGQPYTVKFSSTGTMDNYEPSPGGAAIGNRLIVPVSLSGTQQLACFNDSTRANCAGSWPASAPSGYVGSFGSPFPLVDSTGTLSGVCVPDGNDECYALNGASTPTPAGMQAAVGSGSVNWNGPGLALGPRVYVPAWNNVVYCYDAATHASCANFPKSFNNLGLLYTVNPDPQRPTCIWVNSDNGSSQIQNFDAYTGSSCGQGAVRVLASQFVVPLKKCSPNTYKSLQVLSPAPTTYTQGTIQFDDGDGNPIPGSPALTLDKTGKASLTGLKLNTATGLPQFVITLNGQSGSPGSVVVKLTWTSQYDPSCIGTSTQVSTLPTTLTTALVSGKHRGDSLAVPAGATVRDTSKLSGSHAKSATGTVRYSWYSNSACTKAVAAGKAQKITKAGSMPASAPVKFLKVGKYYAIAKYSGDSGNLPSSSKCGSEKVTVKGSGPSIKVSPSIVPAGDMVRVYGSAGGCPVGDQVTLISSAFGPGHSFAGRPAIVTTVRRGGGYSVRTTIPSNRATGRYAVTGRCGGANFGVTAHFYVTAPSFTG